MEDPRLHNYVYANDLIIPAMVKSEPETPRTFSLLVPCMMSELEPQKEITVMAALICILR